MQISQKRNLTYKVKEGDTLSSICSSLKLDPTEVKALNKITDVYPNQIVLLPKAYKYYYVVKPLDSYESIAKNLNISVQELKNVTNNKKMFIGQKIMF